MIQTRKLMVFDFDGVVCDSTNECLVTSWNAWEEWESRSTFRENLDDFNSIEISFFYKVRPRVKGAGEYYIIRRAFIEGIEINDQETYDFLEEKWREFLNPFKNVFFIQREQLRRKNINNWIKLHYIYKDVIQVMKFFNSRNQLYIATLKDSQSIKIILKNQGLNISKEKLVDQSQIKSKLEALELIEQKTGYSKSEIIFIDDNITHLIEPYTAGYDVFLTTWGSTIKEYCDLSYKYGIPLLGDCKILIDKFGE